MIVEEHRQGVTVAGPALVVRRAGVLDSVQAAQQGAADPRAPWFDPAAYRDRADISLEGRALAAAQRDRVAPTPASASDPTASLDRPIASPATGSAPRGEATVRETGATATSAVSTATDAPARGDVGPASQDPGDNPTDRDGDGDHQNGPSRESKPDENQDVAELKRRDAKVKAHEQAHLAAAGGQAVGGANYQYETGPDGSRYAVEGDVKIRFGGNTPEERLQQAERAARAALAPSEPSAQDRAVAAEARAEATRARQELAQETTKESLPDSAQAPDEKTEASEDRPSASRPHNEDERGSANPSGAKIESPRVANAYRGHSLLATTASLEAIYNPGRQINTFA